MALVNLRYFRAFAAYSEAVAREKGELASFAAPPGGTEGGFNRYEEQLDQDIRDGRVDRGLSPALQQQARLLQAKRKKTFAATVLYGVVLIVLAWLMDW